MKQNIDNEIIISFYTSKELRNKFKLALVKRDATMKDVLNKAIMDYVEEGDKYEVKKEV